MDFEEINKIVAIGLIVFLFVAPVLAYLLNKYVLDRYFNKDFKEYIKTLKADLEKTRT